LQLLSALRTDPTGLNEEDKQALLAMYIQANQILGYGQISPNGRLWYLTTAFLAQEESKYASKIEFNKALINRMLEKPKEHDILPPETDPIESLMDLLPLSLQVSRSKDTVYELTALFIFDEDEKQQKPCLEYFVTVRRAVAIVAKKSKESKKVKIVMKFASGRVLSNLLLNSLTVKQAIESNKLSISPVELGTQFLELFGVKRSLIDSSSD